MKNFQPFLPFPQPQVCGVFLRRPQRFLAEVVLPDGSRAVAYFPNSGSLPGCLEEGSRVLLWDSQNLSRKRRLTVRAVERNSVWIGTDTHLTNRLVEELLRQRLFPDFCGYEKFTREYRAEKGVRFDFLLSGATGNCCLEVKSATVVEKGVARYPDSETPRGLKQLECLSRKAEAGERAVLLYLVQRNDVEAFSLKQCCSLSYAKAFETARAAGVSVLAFTTEVRPAGFGKPAFLPLTPE